MVQERENHTHSGEAAISQMDTQSVVSVDLPNCKHHWIIESPRGALSDGRCKHCGDERQFRNSANDYIWDNYSGGFPDSRAAVRAVAGGRDSD